MNFYRRYIGDYARDTAHLSLAEHGAYNLLLDAYYATAKPLPSDYSALYRICRARGAAEQRAVKSVADQFFPVSDDGLRRNKRADRQIPDEQKRIAVAQQNGSRRGRKPEPGGSPKIEPKATPQEPSGLAKIEQEATRKDTQPDTQPTTQPVNSPSPSPSPFALPAVELRKEGAADAHATAHGHAHAHAQGPPPPAEPDTIEPTAAVALAIVARQHGVETHGSDPRLMALADQGVTPDALAAACDEAVRQRPGERVGIGLVAAILTRWVSQASKVATAGSAVPRDSRQAALERRNAEVAARWVPPELREVTDAA